MRLNSLLTVLGRHPTFQALSRALSTKESGRHVLSAITPARPYALAALHAAAGRPMLLITGRPSEARAYANELRAWAADPEAVLLFPETDALPYDRLPSDPDKLTERLTGFAQSGSPAIVVASVRAAMDLVLEPQAFRDNHRVVKRGQILPPAEL